MYSKLTLKERAALAVSCLMQDDEQRAQDIVWSVPRLNVQMPDPSFYNRAQGLLLALGEYRAQYWMNLATYHAALGKLQTYAASIETDSAKEGEVMAEGAIKTLKAADDNAAVCLAIDEVLDEFCQQVGINPDAVRESYLMDRFTLKAHPHRRVKADKAVKQMFMKQLMDLVGRVWRPLTESVTPTNAAVSDPVKMSDEELIAFAKKVNEMV
jgi:hypothetical protein